MRKGNALLYAPGGDKIQNRNKIDTLISDDNTAEMIKQTKDHVNKTANHTKEEIEGKKITL